MPIELKLLWLLLVANGVPIIAASIWGDWGARPVDGGRLFADGHRLFGKSKTWRGVLLATPATSLMALLLELPVQIGLMVGFGAILGDLLSSFIKRRLGLASSSMALGLDQIPEALLPLLIVADELQLSWTSIGWTVIGFVALELALSPVFYRLGIRKQPY